jgi:hypothetical protein
VRPLKIGGSLALKMRLIRLTTIPMTSNDCPEKSIFVGEFNARYV